MGNGGGRDNSIIQLNNRSHKRVETLWYRQYCRHLDFNNNYFYVRNSAGSNS